MSNINFLTLRPNVCLKNKKNAHRSDEQFQNNELNELFQFAEFIIHDFHFFVHLKSCIDFFQ